MSGQERRQAGETSMVSDFVRSKARSFRWAAALAFAWLVLAQNPAWGEDTCAQPAPPLSQDFNPGGPVPPTVPGKVFYMPHVLRDEFLVASWLQGFYNAVPGYDRGINWGGAGPSKYADPTGMLRAFGEAADFFDLPRPQETDTLILSKYFVDALRQQGQVEAAIQIAKNEVKNNAVAMKNRLACGQSGTYSNRGREIVMGDDYSFSVHLAIGSFSVFWEATCQVGPRRCCIPEAGSESGFREETEYHCDVHFTIYDNYNFSISSGTGGTGLLKRINPLGWFGTSFHQYGRWRQNVEGTLRYDMTPAAAACCRRTHTQPPPPPPPPQPPEPPPVQPPPGDGPTPAGPVPCPECDPIAAQITATEQAMTEADARIAGLRQAAEDNRRKRATEEARLKDLQREQDKGEWTASGTDPDTGVTKDYDATQGDGQVHVTVRDAKGEVIDSYTYPRSRNASEIRAKIEAARKNLADLQAESARLDEQLGNALKEKRRLASELRRLQAELEACLKRCRGVVDDAPAGTGALPGGGCTFPPVKPATLGPRDQFGYGGEQKAAEVGKAAISLLGGLLGGRGGKSGGRGSPLGGGSDDGNPPLADDPIRDKRLFTHPETGTAIKVGGQTRPDGKLLVSIAVDKAEDKGVVHYATLERLQPQADGSCHLQVAEPSEWQHYEIWEDWWAKIRIRRYESVNGGPWRMTHDTGWREWGSGSQLLGSGLLSPDQIPRTAWGSMGADRAFGGPRSAGAVFDFGPVSTASPVSAERLVVHVTRPGQDPVTTVPFVLYPVTGSDGRIGYRETPPGSGDAPR
jgi:hypothetical protein